RRHTRSKRDWSSDVCSSDLAKILLESIMPILSDREQKILQCTFFENKSQKETGELLGISQMRVSRLQRQSLRKLNEFIQSESSEIGRASCRERVEIAVQEG